MVNIFGWRLGIMSRKLISLDIGFWWFYYVVIYVVLDVMVEM